jgi:hypothetical protein
MANVLSSVLFISLRVSRRRSIIRVSDCGRKYVKTITQIAVCLMARWLVPYRAFDLRTVKIKLTRLPTVNRR